MTIRIIKNPISKKELADIAREGFGDMVKAVVDVRQGIMAIGGELHADEEAILTEREGSRREDVWGVNLYPHAAGDGFIEFNSMVNIKPTLGNRSRGVEHDEIRKKIRAVVGVFIVE